MAQKKKILIAEDDDSLRALLAERLRFEGFEVFEAKNGKEGCELAIKHQPDLFSIDIRMPEMGGLEMLEKLRNDECGKDTPAIVWTAYRDPEKVEEARKLGVEDFLVKSDWKLKDVVKKIKEKLNIRE